MLASAAEAPLITPAGSVPTEGRKAWTVRLLAERLVELVVVESVGPETVRRVSISLAGITFSWLP